MNAAHHKCILRWAAGLFALIAASGLQFGPVTAQGPPPGAAKAGEWDFISLKNRPAADMVARLAEIFSDSKAIRSID